MVYYSEIAKSDLRDILWGLANWKKHPLGFEHAERYVNEIRFICDNLEYKSIHFNSDYEIHKKYGEKVHIYKRNNTTNWYIVYNIDTKGNIFINKIISNHLTQI